MRKLKRLIILGIIAIPVTSFGGGDGEYCKPTTLTVTKFRVIDREVVKEVPIRKRNHLQLFILDGPNDRPRFSQQGTNVTASTNTGTYLGIGYSRDVIDINEDVSISLGAQYLTNETIGGSVGLSW